MDETAVPAALREPLTGALARLADWMRNRPE
jgi:truncated hemoglobin YjbI